MSKYNNKNKKNIYNDDEDNVEETNEVNDEQINVKDIELKMIFDANDSHTHFESIFRRTLNKTTTEKQKKII